MSCAKIQPSSCTLQRIVACPVKPYGLVSLLEMMRFYADLFVKTLSRIIEWEVKCSRISNGVTPLSPGIALELYAYVGALFPELHVYGLKSAAMKAQRIHQHLQNNQMRINYGEMTSMLRELRERLEDNLHSTVFVNLSAQESELYEHPEAEWQGVISRFSKLRHDIEESQPPPATGRLTSVGLPSNTRHRDHRPESVADRVFHPRQRHRVRLSRGSRLKPELRWA